ncbi:MAG: hypothetical protein OXL38_09925 [Gammaproteobacteria bacterium]|nr:hypothetical protein [Gammaproteobacteria bacterium]
MSKRHVAGDTRSVFGAGGRKVDFRPLRIVLAIVRIEYPAGLPVFFGELT